MDPNGFEHELQKCFWKLLKTKEYQQARHLYQQYPEQLSPVWQTEYRHKIRQKKFSRALVLAVLFGQKRKWVAPVATAIIKTLLKQNDYTRAIRLLKKYPVDYAKIVVAVLNLPPVKNPLYNKLLEAIEPDFHRDADEIEWLMVQASQAFWQNPDRQGHVVTIAEDCELLLTGDLHGNRRNAELLMATADLEHNPHRHLVWQEIIHSRGLLIDRRDFSFLQIINVLKYLVRFPERVHILLGNHDHNLLRQRETLRNKKKLNHLFERGLALIFAKRAREILQGYRRLIEAMPVAIQCGNLLVTHSNPPAEAVFDLAELKQLLAIADNPKIEALINGRDHSFDAVSSMLRQAGAKFSVIGHEICHLGYEQASPTQLIIDSCHNRGYYLLCRPSKVRIMRDLKSGLRPIRIEDGLCVTAMGKASLMLR